MTDTWQTSDAEREKVESMVVVEEDDSGRKTVCDR